MKKISLLIILSFSLSVAIAQHGTAFLQGGNLRTPFDLATAQNKPVMLEVYAPTCHVCNAFKPTFEDAQVGNFINQNFISYKLDITTPEGTAFLNKQGLWIASTPTLLFFDKNVKLMHVSVLGENMNSPQILIDAATKALNPKQRTAAYKASYQAGNREPNFLIEHAFISRIVRDTVSNIAAMSEYAKKMPVSKYGNNSNFLVLQKVIMDDENPLFKYMMAHLDEFNKKYDKITVKQTAENILMYSLYSPRGMKYSVGKINTVRANLIRLGVDKKSIDGRLWREETNAYFRENKPAQAMKILEGLLDAKSTKESYKFLSNWVKMKTSDKVALAKAAAWAVKGK